MLKEARHLKEVIYEGQRIHIFLDLSTEAHKCQREFDGVKAELRALLYPAYLVIP